MKNKSKITGIRQKAQKSVDKSESSIDRFSRFMGVISKGISKDIPSKKTLKKARLFAKNFGGGRSAKVNKMLLGGAIMLPLVLGQMMSKERSTEELLQTQYGGNEKAMQKDLDEEQKVRDEGLKKVETTADENKDIALDKKKDLQAVSQKGPEEITESEVNSDDSTLERMNDRLTTEDQSLDKKNVEQFGELMDRFKFLAKQGAFMGEEEGPSVGEKLNNLRKKVMKDIRKVTGGKVDDGVYSLGFGINVVNPLSKKGRNIIKNTTSNLWNTVFGPKNDKDKKTEKSDIEKINEVVKAQLEENEKQFRDAGGISLPPGSEELKNYLRTKTELEKLQERIQKDPFKVVAEFMAAANPSSVSSQSSMLSLTVDTGEVPTKVANDLDFQRGVNELAQKYNVSVQDLYAVMSFESGGTFDPSKKNMQGSGATGLIQFMPSTAKGLGTSTEELSKMTRTEQLKYVDKYFSNKGIEGGNLDDLYMSILFPVAVGKPDDFVLFGKGAIEGYRGIAYDQNAGLDKNGDGSITKAEAAASVRSHKGAMGFTESTDPMGDQSSLNPNNPNMIAQLSPEGYMPYDDPAGSPPQLIALTPQLQTAQAGVVATGSGGDGSPQIMPITDVGAILSQIQLNNLART